MKILGVIPSRYASTRFPGKPLAAIQGKSMVQRVYEQALSCTGLTDVVVATDDERIRKHIQGFGGKVVMTGTHHQSGTDRCAEALETFPSGTFGAVINIQGDEPFIQPGQIDLLCAALQSGSVRIATLIKRISSTGELLNPNTPKVLLNNDGLAIYFSRSPLPYIQGKNPEEWLLAHTYYKHIGMYGYRADVLGQIAKLPASSWETAESLEQLRWLQNGFTIRAVETKEESIAIDTPGDLEKLS